MHLNHIPHTIISSYYLFCIYVIFFVFACVQQVSSVPAKHYSMTGTLCTAAWANVAQCYLVKGFDRNVFGKCEN